MTNKITPDNETTIITFKGKTGLPRLKNAFFYSMDGFKSAYRHEDAFRQELYLTLILIPLAFYLEANTIHRILMVASLLLVIMAELINSAIEAVVDRISLEHHSLAKRAKDLGSATVFVALANAVLVWALILFS